MRTLRNVRSGRQSGIVLLWSVFAAMAIFAAAFVMSTLASSAKRISEVDFRRTGASYLSQGAVAFATERILAALEAGTAPPRDGTATLAGRPVAFTIERVGAPAEVRLPSGASRIVSTYRVEGRAELDGVTALSRQVVRGVLVLSEPDSGSEGQTLRTFTPARVEIENVVSW